MSHAVKSCPNCGNDKLTDNGGADSHTIGHAAHGVTHGILHHNPIFLAVGVLGLAARALNPKKYTCLICGHSFKA